MYLLYLDEFGHTGRWIPNDPHYGHHPFFGLAGFAIPGDRWADLDRQFFRLKRDLYKKELAQFVISKGERPERFEPKQLKSRRDIVFAAEVLNLVNQNQGHVFAYGYHKSVDFQQHRDHAIYIGCVQNSMLNYEKYLKDRAGRKAGQGLIIMDRRNDALNSVVLGAAQSFIFGRAQDNFGRPIDRIVEAPLLVPSEWYHGVQMADMLGRAMSAVNLHRLGLQRGLTKLEAILGPKLDAFGYTKDTWGTVYQFLIHGAKYAFPTKLGQVTRGFPTAHAASPLKDELQADTDLPPVWPHKDGTVRGTSVEPLYKSATEAALADPALYELLALLDALRMGKARERQLAAQFLEERLK